MRVNTTSLHVSERSSHSCDARPTLVFLHYFGGSGRAWEKVMDGLASQGWGCLAPDLRGFGDSPAPGEAAVFYAVDTMADDIQELIRKLQLPRFILVGHSMGGKVALALAARQLVGLSGVALLAPSPPTPEPMDAAERGRLLDSYGDPAVIQETLGKITAHGLPPSIFDTTVADNLRASAPAWRAWLERGSREDISARLPQVTAPVRVAVGGEDKTITGCLVEREIIARLTCTAASSAVLPGVGHLLPLEAPGETLDFLSAAFVQFECAVQTTH